MQHLYQRSTGTRSHNTEQVAVKAPCASTNVLPESHALIWRLPSASPSWLAVGTGTKAASIAAGYGYTSAHKVGLLYNFPAFY